MFKTLYAMKKHKQITVHIFDKKSFQLVTIRWRLFKDDGGKSMPVKLLTA